MTSNEDKTPNTRIKYLDGHTDEVCVTMWQRCQAETHGKTKGWGNLMEAAVKFNAYSAYVRCRQIGVTTLPFEQWADTVVSVEDTPWAWRREQVPQEADWGTCTQLLKDEAEETEKTRRKVR